MSSTRHPARRRLAALGPSLALALVLGACGPTGETVVPAADEQPANDTAPDPVPLPQGETYKGATTETCTDPMPGSYC
jgi:hypothetical protein